jgi:outer membrane protein assembly factor BamB
MSKLRVVNEKVVVPAGASLTVYTLQGQLIKQIKVPGMTTSWKALAVCGDDSVIVSDCGTSSVHRVNIDSGEVMWTSKHVNYPQGVVCYKDRYVLIANRNTETKIWILDVDTGNFTIWLYHMFFCYR